MSLAYKNLDPTVGETRWSFVELGFRPAVLIIKSESGSRNWIIIDSTRDTFNPSDRARSK